jgi:hypothetical protein
VIVSINPTSVVIVFQLAERECTLFAAQGLCSHLITLIVVKRDYRLHSHRIAHINRLENRPPTSGDVPSRRTTVRPNRPLHVHWMCIGCALDGCESYADDHGNGIFDLEHDPLAAVAAVPPHCDTLTVTHSL